MLAWTKQNTMQRAKRTVLEWPQSHATSKTINNITNKYKPQQKCRLGTVNKKLLGGLNRLKTFNGSEISLTISGTNTKVKKFPSVHVLGDFNFRDIDWPDRLNKSSSALSQSEGQMLTDIMNDHGLEQLVHFPTREKIHWIYYSLLFLVSFGIFTHRTNSAIMILLLELKLSFPGPRRPPPPPLRNLGERCIYIRKVIMNL